MAMSVKTPMTAMIVTTAAAIIASATVVAAVITTIVVATIAAVIWISEAEGHDWRVIRGPVHRPT
jgi:hypothetical protein